MNATTRMLGRTLCIIAAAVLLAAAPRGIARAAAPGGPQPAPACDPARAHAAGTSTETIPTINGTRTYLLHVPASYTGAAAVPLVLNFHGAGSSPVAQEVYSGFSARADAENFIVAYPQGVTTANLAFTHFNAWQLGSPEPDDVAFADTLIDTLESALCIDTTHVFSTGISMGAIMSTRLACSLSNRIAAIAPVSGAYYPPNITFLNPAESCPGPRPVPLLAFHGTADTTIPFNGGPGLNGVLFRLPIDNTTPDEDVLSDWAAHDGCAGSRQESPVDTEIRLITYGSCPGGAVVQLYAVDGGGHTWPGSFDLPSLGYTTHQIIATDLIWAFFAAHPFAAPPSVGGIAEQPDAAVLTPSSITGSQGRADVRRAAEAALAIAGVAVGGWMLRRSRAAR